MKKIISMLFMFVLVVHVYLAFAQIPITITVIKETIEADLAGFNLYQDENPAPFATLDAKIIPWVWEGDITLVNGKTTIMATAFDDSGNESEKSLGALFDPPPGAPSLTITINATIE